MTVKLLKSIDLDEEYLMTQMKVCWIYYAISYRKFGLVKLFDYFFFV